MTEQNELKWLERAAQGDLDSFNQLVLMYQTIVYNTAYRILFDENLADDLTQTAFISAWKHIETFRGDSFKPWIVRITINACYDELRRQRRRPTVPLEPLSAEDDEPIEDTRWLIDPSSSPLETMEKNETLANVEDCLNRMAMDYRAVLTLIDVQEMNYQEVSEIVGKPLGTVKSRLFRARAKMRDCLKAKGELFHWEERLESEEEE